MAIYESLGRVPALPRAAISPPGTVCPRNPTPSICNWPVADYDWNRVPADLSRELEVFLARGNRLVITFFPQTSAHANPQL